MSVAKVPPGMSRDAIVAITQKELPTLKAQGWKEEDKDFGAVSCYLMTPPAGQQDAPAMTSCLVLAKGTIAHGDQFHAPMRWPLR